MNNNVIISIDVETDGPIPGVNSMLSLGAVAFDENGKEIDCFQANIKPLKDGIQNESTMKWWATQPEAWKAINDCRAGPDHVMNEFWKWLMKFKRPTAVGYPVTFDFMFIYWYLMKFCGTSPLGFQGQDIKTMAAIALGLPYRDATKQRFPKKWFNPKLKHTHVPVDDAREQGFTYFAILESLNARLDVAPYNER